jgi:hypothetical protein
VQQREGEERAMSAPKWATGMRRIHTGTYLDQAGRLHMDLPGMCGAFGVPATRKNMATIEAAARRAAKDAEAKVKITTIEDSQP